MLHYVRTGHPSLTSTPRPPFTARTLRRLSTNRQPLKPSYSRTGWGRQQVSICESERPSVSLIDAIPFLLRYTYYYHDIHPLTVLSSCLSPSQIQTSGSCPWHASSVGRLRRYTLTCAVTTDSITLPRFRHESAKKGFVIATFGQGRSREYISFRYVRAAPLFQRLRRPLGTVQLV